MPLKTIVKTVVGLEDMDPQSAPPKTLTCVFATSPDASISWFLNGEKVQEMSTQTFNPRKVGKTTNTSAILASTFSIRCPPKSGTYECIADNDAKIVKSTRYLHFDNVPSSCPPILKQAPTIWGWTMGRFETEHNVAILSCRASSPNATLTWQWFFNGQEILTDGRFKILETGDLKIRNIQWADKGSYFCIARNIYGESTRETFLYPFASK